MAERTVSTRLKLNVTDFVNGAKQASTSLDDLARKGDKTGQVASTGLGKIEQRTCGWHRPHQPDGAPAIPGTIGQQASGFHGEVRFVGRNSRNVNRPGYGHREIIGSKGAKVFVEAHGLVGGRNVVIAVFHEGTHSKKDVDLSRCANVNGFTRGGP